jgi:hypothetical protein
VSRAVSGALPATSLLLLMSCCAVSVASAAEISCNRSLTAGVATDEAPGDGLHLRMVDLGNVTETSEPASPDEFDLGGTAPAPDLSSRARSLAILKEIFGEAAYEDDIDARLPPPDLAPAGNNPATEESPPLRQPAAATESEPDVTSGENSEAADSDARLPGISDEEAKRYRSQMYRTDI